MSLMTNALLEKVSRTLRSPVNHLSYEECWAHSILSEACSITSDKYVSGLSANTQGPQ